MSGLLSNRLGSDASRLLWGMALGYTSPLLRSAPLRGLSLPLRGPYPASGVLSIIRSSAVWKPGQRSPTRTDRCISFFFHPTLVQILRSTNF